MMEDHLLSVEEMAEYLGAKREPSINGLPDTKRLLIRWSEIMEVQDFTGRQVGSGRKDETSNRKSERFR